MIPSQKNTDKSKYRFSKIISKYLYYQYNFTLLFSLSSIHVVTYFKNSLQTILFWYAIFDKVEREFSCYQDYKIEVTFWCRNSEECTHDAFLMEWPIFLVLQLVVGTHGKPLLSKLDQHYIPNTEDLFTPLLISNFFVLGICSFKFLSQLLLHGLNMISHILCSLTHP